MNTKKECKCSVTDCQQNKDSKGFCKRHYYYYKRYGDPLKGSSWRYGCNVDNCKDRHVAKGYCSKHYTRFSRYGDPLGGGNFRGNGYYQHGYKILFKPDHPNSSKTGFISEHRFVMSNILGRPLKRKETIHHKNGIKNDNRPENLEIWSSSQPSGQRVEDKIKWAVEFLKQYDMAEYFGVEDPHPNMKIDQEIALRSKRLKKTA